MAVNPIPDQSKEFMKSGMVLITDPKSDKYLNRVRKDKSPCRTNSEQKNM
jgi:hypothetical protein